MSPEDIRVAVQELAEQDWEYLIAVTRDNTELHLALGVLAAVYEFVVCEQRGEITCEFLEDSDVG